MFMVINPFSNFNYMYFFQCQQPFTDQDVIVLNGTDEDVKVLQIKMANRNANRKSSKKSKVKVEAVETPQSSETVEVNGKDNIKNESEPGPSQVKKDVETIPLSLPKYNDKYIRRGPFGSTKRAHPNKLLEDPSYKKTKKDYSVANDPKSSEVFKSIFTSHKSEKDQQRAHWVTYNPFYN